MTSTHTTAPSATPLAPVEPLEGANYSVTPLATSQSQEHDTTAQHVDDLFKKWTLYIAQKLKLKKHRKRNTGDADHESEEGIPRLDLSQVLEITKFVVASSEEGIQFEGKEESAEGRGSKGNAAMSELRTLDHEPPLSHDQFLQLVQEARLAISRDIHPRLNSKGSSGSYFVRDLSDSTTLGIFKPSDEDPYGALNPKLLKYIHRSLHKIAPRIVPFGRSCLIPGQSYLSESAASVLDRKLETWIVPRTEVVGLRSKAFYYDVFDRERARKEGGQLREKDGSFQVFLKGFTDASDFFAKHPYPSTSRSSTSNRRQQSLVSSCLPCCGLDSTDSFSDDSTSVQDATPAFEWTQDMVESFQLELEKLVILDYLIRNTDRGLDNFMIKPCPPSSHSDSASSSRTASPSTCVVADTDRPHLHIAAIDNSLAFPHTHPQGWRQYPYGWLYLPLPLLDNPWSDSNRSHYLEKLEDPQWWSELHRDLREEFRQGKAWTEADESMWKKQWSVVKGQGWNLVRSLREPKEGPLELTRRKKVLVWDEYVLVAEPKADQEGTPSQAISTSPSFSSTTVPSNVISVSYSRTPQMTTKPPPLSHRRTLSDYTTSTYGSTSKTTRPPLTVSKNDRRTASFLRRPLDSLASSPRKPFRALLHRNLSSSSSSSSISRLHGRREASDGGGQGDEEEQEEEEETGFTFLRKLDKLEATEQKRARKVEKEAKKLGLMGSAREEEASQKNRRGRLLPRSRGENGGSLDERSRLLAANEEESDDEEEAVAGWGTSSEIILNGKGRNAAEESGRLSMSWYGGGPGGTGSLGIEGVLDEASRRNAHDDRTADRIVDAKKWVVHERLEHVPEPKRRFRLPF